MKLIINSADLEKEFLRLSKDYKKYYWATAWAGISSSVFSYLITKTERIEKIIVGIHFYQTHPDFAKAILNYADKLKLSYEEPANFEVIKGRGVKAEVESNTVLLGNKTFMEEAGIPIQKSTVDNIDTLIYLSINKELSAR